MFVTIRGVESNPFIINRAAMYIDGIPFRELSNAVLNQVESIEVLRGPQATLRDQKDSCKEASAVHRTIG